MQDKALFRLQVVQHACASKCMGRPGNNGGCCNLGPRDWIIGPISDVDELIEKVSERWGRPALRIELLIDYEEGRLLFPERPTWQDPKNYPAMRVLGELPHPCRFHNREIGCTIHDIRPGTCQAFECDWLRQAVGALF
jgi:Fe-S-cluster containining protein